jgi:hypothetical protein
MFTPALPGAARRRENRARFWDVIAENCATLLRVYDSIADMPADVEIQPRMRARVLELIESEKDARRKAARIRSGLE